MAKASFFRPVDMETGWGPDLPDAFTRVGDERLVVRSEGVRLDYRGAFDVEDGEVLGGTIETIRASFRGEPLYKITDISYDLLDYAHLWATEGYLSALQIAFEGDDTIRGSGGADVLNGFIGDDVIRGGRGDDSLQGEVGDDRLSGGGGEDFLDGWDGRDRIKGGGGDDTLFGGDGDDRLKGNRGEDVLFGEGGDDVLLGGRGADGFVFDLDDGQDVIRDYEPGIDFIALWDGATLEDVEVEDVARGTVIQISETTEVFLRGVFDFDEAALIVL